MMSIDEVLHEWQRRREISQNITLISKIPQKQGKSFPLESVAIFEKLKKGLEKKGITSLYSHQKEGIEQIFKGRNIVIATPTASGKTLIYNIPVLNHIIKDEKAKALYLFPTKSLAQDQYNELLDLIKACDLDIKTFTYDGDTPHEARKVVREKGNIVISNPDMLHSAILPHHTKWARFFSGLKYVVIDEIHSYRGVFGSHLTNVIRRLKRIALHYGQKIQFILCSATIKNPKEHAERIVEDSVYLIDRSGAPSGERVFVFYNPPVINEQLGIKKNYILETRKLALIPIKMKIPTIIFVLSRLNVEILLRYLREDLKKSFMDPELVQGYRGGYLPLKRRKIEQGLKSGEIIGVVSTNALELGIDIGHLDVSIIAGYPGSVASFMQRAGRAGRKHKKSLVLYVSKSSPIDQYLIHKPEMVLKRNSESARINPDNIYIAAEHIKCATYEMPFAKGETLGNFPKEHCEKILEHLAAHRIVNPGEKVYYWSDRGFPAANVSLRNIPGENFTVIDASSNNRVIAEVDFHTAYKTLYENAIYPLDGEFYQVMRLDVEGHRAYVKKVKQDYYTDALTYTKIDILSKDREKRVGNSRVFTGDVKVSEKVIGFKKIKLYTNENLGYGEINLPELVIHTMGVWIFPKLSFDLAKKFQDRVLFVDALAGLSYAFKHISAILLMCDSHDIGRAIGDDETGEFLNLSQITVSELAANFKPHLYFFDIFPGGVGLSEEIFEKFESFLQETFVHIKRCECENGCPSCIGPYRYYYKGLKQNVLSIIESMLH